MFLLFVVGVSIQKETVESFTIVNIADDIATDVWDGYIYGRISGHPSSQAQVNRVALRTTPLCRFYSSEYLLQSNLKLKWSRVQSAQGTNIVATVYKRFELFECTLPTYSFENINANLTPSSATRVLRSISASPLPIPVLYHASDAFGHVP
jgi:hypothetical protein